jgi:two-component system OmpR family response regulator
MLGPSPYIIVIDDDLELRDLIAEFLREQDMEVATASNATELDAMLARRRPDLLVLDIMMPGESGLSVVQRLVGPARPGIVLLSAMGDDVNRIEGLDLGADDYLVKPCNPQELLARIRAVLRRRNAPQSAPVRRRRFGDCVIDLFSRRLERDGRSTVQLTDAEYRVLTAMLDAPLTVLSRDRLLDAARGESADIFDRAIDVTISRLRRKLGGGEPIRTIRSEGYMLAMVPQDV